jgi:exodeoxyribonuclease-3
MRIVTWNINSIRIRVDMIREFVEKHNPDILCLQETKVEDDSFPHKEMQQMGFGYRVVRGEKSYNGVAILSKIPITEADRLVFVNEQSRHISVVTESGIEIHNFYVPAGGDIPCPDTNPKFKHKLDYVDHAAEWFRRYRSKEDKIILLGDLNIAPGKKDVWSHRQLLDIVSHTYMEKFHFHKLMKSLEFSDIVREQSEIEDKIFSWWSYRNKDWKKSNKGRRLDHILASPGIRNQCKKHKIYTEFRDYKRPSDHAPVLLEMSL